jgi:phosphate transport system protein
MSGNPTHQELQLQVTLRHKGDMERHWQHDLGELRQRLLWMGSLAERAVRQAVHAVLNADEHLAKAVHAEEGAINEMQIEIDERVQRLLALQAPMAVDLRFLLAVSRINGDLERIGDQAVNIAHSASNILRHPQVMKYVDLPKMGELAEGMVRDSLNAVVGGDQELAQSVLLRDDQVDRLRDQMFRELLTRMMEDSAVVFAAFELILVAQNLERIGDHATNIAEDVIYVVAGRDVRHPAVDRR